MKPIEELAALVVRGRYEVLGARCLGLGGCLFYQ